MNKVKLEIKIDSNTLRIDYFVLGGKSLNPNTHFTFKKGEWYGKFDDFPLSDENEIYFLIIVIGNPETTSKISILVDGLEVGCGFKLEKPFNKNGYGQFNKTIHIEQLPIV